VKRRELAERLIGVATDLIKIATDVAASGVEDAQSYPKDAQQCAECLVSMPNDGPRLVWRGRELCRCCFEWSKRQDDSNERVHPVELAMRASAILNEDARQVKPVDARELASFEHCVDDVPNSWES